MTDLDKKNALNDRADPDYRKALDGAYPQPSPGFHDKVMAEVRSLREQEKKKRKLTASFVRWGSLAACFILLVAIVAVVVRRGGNLENKADMMPAAYDYDAAEGRETNAFADEQSFFSADREKSENSVFTTSGEYHGTDAVPSDTCSAELDSVYAEDCEEWTDGIGEPEACSAGRDAPGAGMYAQETPLSILNSAILSNSTNTYGNGFVSPDSAEEDEDLTYDLYEFMNYSVPMWANCSRVMNPPGK